MQLSAFVLSRPTVGPEGPTVQPFLDAVRQAEEYGFTRIVTSDSQLNNMECVSALSAMAMVTRRAQIGPQVTNPVTRDVGVMAAAIGSVDLLSGGRAVWVIGRGDGAVHNAGLRPATVDGLREYFLAIRSMFETGEAVYQGRTVRYHWPEFWAGGPPRKVPLHLVAEGPRMLELAGEVADGVLIGTGLTPEVIKDSLDRLEAGAHRAGRTLHDIDIWWGTRCSVATTWDDALEHSRESLSSAGNHALRQALEQKQVPEPLLEPIRRFHRMYDYSQKGGGRNRMLMEELGLTPYFLDRFGLVGTPDQLVERLRYLDSLGVHNVSVQARGTSLTLLGEQVLPEVLGNN